MAQQWDQRGDYGRDGSDYRGRGYSSSDNDRSDDRGSYRGQGYDGGQSRSGRGEGYGRRSGSDRYESAGYYGARDHDRDDRYNSGGYSDRDRRDERGMFEKGSDEIRSWFGDDDAERRRRMDEHRGKGPKGYQRSDDRIREDVCDRLSDDGRLDASEIDVKVEDGEVTLSGTVDDRQSKRRAEDCVEDVSGVKHVQNNLRATRMGNGGSSSAAGSATRSPTGTTGKGQSGETSAKSVGSA